MEECHINAHRATWTNISWIVRVPISSMYNSVIGALVRAQLCTRRTAVHMCRNSAPVSLLYMRAIVLQRWRAALPRTPVWVGWNYTVPSDTKAVQQKALQLPRLPARGKRAKVVGHWEERGRLRAERGPFVPSARLDGGPSRHHSPSGPPPPVHSQCVTSNALRGHPIGRYSLHPQFTNNKRQTPMRRSRTKGGAGRCQ